jgi:hypothetical protein
MQARGEAACAMAERASHRTPTIGIARTLARSLLDCSAKELRRLRGKS